MDRSSPSCRWRKIRWKKRVKSSVWSMLPRQNRYRESNNRHFDTHKEKREIYCQGGLIPFVKAS